MHQRFWSLLLPGTSPGRSGAGGTPYGALACSKLISRPVTHNEIHLYCQSRPPDHASREAEEGRQMKWECRGGAVVRGNHVDVAEYGAQRRARHHNERLCIIWFVLEQALQRSILLPRT